MLSKLLRARTPNDARNAPDNTRGIAKNRLNTALSRDRYDLLSPAVVDSLERDVLAAISRHLEVDGGFHELGNSPAERLLLPGGQRPHPDHAPVGRRQLAANFSETIYCPSRSS